MLNRAFLYLIGVAILSAASFMVTRSVVINQAPMTVMTTIADRIASGAGGWNACFHNRAYGPRLESARRANPDSIISSMAYDLSEGPVRVAGETWPRYWSISLYQQNSDNFFVMNDLEMASSSFEFILALDGQDTTPFEGVPIISPTEKGIMLIRRFAAHAGDMDGIIANQDALTCAPASPLPG
ncbi:MAG: DUF1254 domain-containing protein [Pseudomonadota bacterium]